MANDLSKIKTRSALLSGVDQKMVVQIIDRMLGHAEEDGEREPTTTRRPRNSERSAAAAPVAKRGRGRPPKAAIAATEKRGRGRPRKIDEEDQELVRPSRRQRDAAPAKNNNNNRKAPAAAPRKAAAPRAAAGAIDFADMSKNELASVADTWKITNGKLLRDPNRLRKALVGIQKLANSSKSSVASVEKMASRANVELSFGKGRPPLTDEGLKRRVLVKMVNEGAFTG